MAAGQEMEISEAQIAVHWREEDYYPAPAKFIGQANATDPAIFERFSEDLALSDVSEVLRDPQPLDERLERIAVEERLLEGRGEEEADGEQCQVPPGRLAPT